MQTATMQTQPSHLALTVQVLSFLIEAVGGASERAIRQARQHVWTRNETDDKVLGNSGVHVHIKTQCVGAALPRTPAIGGSGLVSLSLLSCWPILESKTGSKPRDSWSVG